MCISGLPLKTAHDSVTHTGRLSVLPSTIKTPNYHHTCLDAFLHFKKTYIRIRLTLISVHFLFPMYFLTQLLAICSPVGSPFKSIFPTGSFLQIASGFFHVTPKWGQS